MSRHERRDSDSRRHRSRFDQEPSPKRSRRDSKLETERHLASNASDVRKNSDQERKNQPQLQDAVHLEALSRQDYKTERTAREVSEKKRDVHTEEMKHSSSPKRSRRDSKPETGRHITKDTSDVRINSDQARKNPSQLQDAVHLEALSTQDYKTERIAREVSEQKKDVQTEGMKHSSSPKRSRLDSKKETDRHLTNNTSDVIKNSDQEQKNPPLLQDAVLLEAPSRQDCKTERTAREVSEQKRDVHMEGMKHSSSPKRSMRDNKQETERHFANNISDVRKNSDQERNAPFQLQDAVHLEAPSRQDYKAERAAREASEQKRDIQIEGMKHPSSPKRSRRDGKQETERHLTNNTSDVRKKSYQEQKAPLQLQDAVHLDAPSRLDYKTERAARKISDPSELSQHRSVKRSSDPAEVPRSQSYFQHDERGNAGQDGRSSRGRELDGHGQRRDPKEQVSRKTTNDTLLVDQKTNFHRKESGAWRHDGYFELESNPKPPAKRRSFREQKTSADPEKVDKAETEPAKPNSSYRTALHADRRNERSSYVSRRPDQYEKQFARERETNRNGVWQGRFPSRRDRYYDSSSFMGRDKFGSRPEYRSNKTVDKWKHDLFSEANKSPPPLNEEDQIAKIEALLAS